ncbi:hypothetical protein GCM10009660_36410 [Catellatospora bangladeshensis]
MQHVASVQRVAPGRRVSPERHAAPGQRVSPEWHAAPGQRVSPEWHVSSGQHVTPERRVAPREHVASGWHGASCPDPVRGRGEVAERGVAGSHDRARERGRAR